MDIADQLKRLAELRDRGVLSAAEFEHKRRAVFSQSFSVPPVQGAAAPHDEQDGPMDAIGAYDLHERVGEGGMGTVYRGQHRVSAMASRQGGDVAVKLLHAHLAGKEGWVARFRREAEALAALDHQNIVRIYDVVEESGRFGLVMEWVPGRPLSQVIGRETGPIPWERARLLVDPLLSAVAHAHGRGVVHRDLKPDNIRITPDGTVKVLDFGIARLGESRGRTKTGTGMGTVDYMAPEQYADAKSVDARADVYALGMTIYEMVAGRLPWEPGDSEFGVLQRKHNGDVGPPTDFYPSIPPWVVAAIMAALRPDPLRRTASVAQLREALFRSEDDLQLDAPEKPQGRPREIEISAAPDTRSGEGIIWLMFSFRGRIGRVGYLRAWLHAFAGLMALGCGLFLLPTTGDATLLAAVFGVCCWFLLLWFQVASMAKRFHDLNQSGWWGVLGVVPYVSCLFQLVLLVLAGSPGPNRFGAASRW